MRENSQWSLNCGMWGGVCIYVHASLLAAFVGIVYFAGQVAHQKMEDGPLYGLMACAVLLISLVAHEIGHAVAAWRLNGRMDLVV
jgi:hypothetical protein